MLNSSPHQLGGGFGLVTPKGTSAVRAPSALSAAKQDRLDALRSERMRIMQAQASLMARPRSVNRSAAGTPFGRTLASPAPNEELDRLKAEIRQLKINEELAKERISGLEKALDQAQASAAVPTDTSAVDKLKQQLAREKERVFSLATEKQKLEEELHAVRLDRFRSEQLENEVRVLKANAAKWEADRELMSKQLETLRKEHDALRNQYKTEKSQRLVMAASLEQLERDLVDASRVSSIAPIERRPTMLEPETIRVFQLSAQVPASAALGEPGNASSVIAERGDSTRLAERMGERAESPKMSLPGVSARTSNGPFDENTTPTKPLEQRRVSETSFVDVEQRGSARKMSVDMDATTANVLPAVVGKSDLPWGVGQAEVAWTEDKPTVAAKTDLAWGDDQPEEAEQTVKHDSQHSLGDVWGHEQPVEADVWGGVKAQEPADVWNGSANVPAHQETGEEVWGHQEPWQASSRPPQTTYESKQDILHHQGTYQPNQDAFGHHATSHQPQHDVFATPATLQSKPAAFASHTSYLPNQAGFAQQAHAQRGPDMYHPQPAQQSPQMYNQPAVNQSHYSPSQRGFGQQQTQPAAQRSQFSPRQQPGPTHYPPVQQQYQPSQPVHQVTAEQWGQQWGVQPVASSYQQQRTGQPSGSPIGQQTYSAQKAPVTHSLLKSSVSAKPTPGNSPRTAQVAPGPVHPAFGGASRAASPFQQPQQIGSVPHYPPVAAQQPVGFHQHAPQTTPAPFQQHAPQTTPAPFQQHPPQAAPAPFQQGYRPQQPGGGQNYQGGQFRY